MKQYILALLCLVGTEQSAHAVNAKKAMEKIIRCTWQLAKIGGGLVCLTVTPGVGIITYLTHKAVPSIPDIPEVSPEQINTVVTLFGNGVSPVIDNYFNQLIAGTQDTPIQQRLRDAHAQFQVTPAQIAGAEQWLIANRTHLRNAAQNSADSWNTLRRLTRNVGLLYLVSFFTAGTVSTWSGITGLYEELSSHSDPEADLSDMKFAE